MKTFYKSFKTLFFTLLFYTSATSQVAYVNHAATGAGDGSSWADAYTDLTAALAATATGEVWIAAGTYTPSNVALDTFNAFEVNNAISIFGGFDGTEVSKDDREPGTNTTILSGDIQGDDINNNFTINKEDNVFHVMTCAAPPMSVIVIDEITFQGGHTRESSDNDDLSWRGGAIYSLNTLELSNCNFNNNFARSAGSVFLSNTAEDSSNGSIVDNCVFENNSCVTQGAGLYAATVHDVTVRNCTFENNTTNRGALYPLRCQNFQVDNCIFKNNVSTTPDNFGGAMFIWNSTGGVRNCTFESNSSGNGAGVHLNGSELEIASADNFIFDNCVFTGNSAVDFGGGAIRASSASYTVTNCEFNLNFGANGAGIFSNGDNQEVIGMNNTFTGNSSDFGACQACYGDFTNYNLTNNTYIGNTANTSGAALINGFGANVTVDQCEFTANIARFGGAIFNQNDTTNVTILNSSFMENTAGDGNGGAVNISGPVTLTIDNCLFQMNSAGFGGAINGSEGDVDIIEGYLHISNSLLLLNNASLQGAAISLIDLDLEMTNTVIGTNLALGDGTGGGLSLNSTSGKTASFNILNSTIADNFATLGSGISAYAEDETAICNINLQNTLLQNLGFNYQVEDGAPTVTSSGGNISSDGSLETVMTNVGDQINVPDMKFVNSANYDFSIEDDSPAIDNGVAEGAPETDILGNPRVGNVDSGAYENQDPSSVEVIANNGQLTLFPNPVHTLASLRLNNDWNGDVLVSILDINGKLISNRLLRKTGQEMIHDLDLENLNVGSYILTLTSKDQKISTSFIKI